MATSEIRYISNTDTAKLIRRTLKETYPSIKFSVKCDGNSIRVHYTNGPRSKDIDEAVKGFAGSTFDGMTDMREDHTSILNGETVRFRTHYVFVERTTTVDFVTKVAQAYCTWDHQVMPEILESCGGGYIERGRLADDIMPLVRDCAEKEVDHLTIGCEYGRIAIIR